MPFHLQPGQSKSVIHISVPIHSHIHISVRPELGAYYTLCRNLITETCSYAGEKRYGSEALHSGRTDFEFVPDY
jgi:hypothetical protein